MSMIVKPDNRVIHHHRQLEIVRVGTYEFGVRLKSTGQILSRWDSRQEALEQIRIMAGFKLKAKRNAARSAL